MRRGSAGGAAIALAAIAVAWLAWPVAGVEEKSAASAPSAPESAAPAAPSAPGEVAAPNDALDPDAVDVLRKMVKALTEAQSLHLNVDEEYDALQADGETFSFGKSGNILLRRPDRLRVEGADRAGNDRYWTYDGKQLTVYDSDRNVFAAVEKTGDIDAVMDFLRDEVGMKLPLAPLFSLDLRALLLDNVTTATFVDEEILDGVELDHIAFQYGDGVGVQLWIPREGDALPRRMVMTFEDARGRPQFRADFREWDLKTKIKDSAFHFDAPKGARAVPFVLPKRTPAGTTGEAPR
ncbi:MAG TPA: DUF2092 domain-containing protein [Myxococcota bacterium]|nr:DUF2092 domain-containing protein [Myxococcota bacterium]